MRIKLFAKTVWDLTFKQILFRIWYRAKPVLFLEKLFAKEGLVEGKVIDPQTEFIKQSMDSKQSIKKRSFCFLNESVRFDAMIEWGFSGKGRLWTYNLHYFQYLNLGSIDETKHARLLIRDWIAKNPVGLPDAWDPFPISLRLVNWIKFDVGRNILGEDRKIVTDSMTMQTRWLMKHLEYHLLGNHLFKNGKALVFMGVFFEGPEADKWLKKGIEIVSSELDEQILGDGGHFERSPMYHSMILEDCLDLINILGEKAGLLGEKLEQKADLMIGFLDAICHPDGRISLFNDAAFGIEAEPDQLMAYYERVRGRRFEKKTCNIQALSETGYYILAPDDENKMIIDCGPVGPDYQPGHSHCDTLSFELSVKARRVIVDSGCFQYVDSSIRTYNRGNIGHNTLTIDNENQSEVWGAHRCARKAKPLDIEWGDKDGRLYFRGGHDGYMRLKGKPVHSRTIEQDPQGWKIKDEVTGKGAHDVESRLHIHPSMTVHLMDGGVNIRFKGKPWLFVRPEGDLKIMVEKGWYCPEFGKKMPCAVLVLRVKNVELPFESGWQLLMEQ